MCYTQVTSESLTRRRRQSQPGGLRWADCSPGSSPLSRGRHLPSRHRPCRHLPCRHLPCRHLPCQHCHPSTKANLPWRTPRSTLVRLDEMTGPTGLSSTFLPALLFSQLLTTACCYSVNLTEISSRRQPAWSFTPNRLSRPSLSALTTPASMTGWTCRIPTIKQPWPTLNTVKKHRRRW